MIPKVVHYIWLGGKELDKVSKKCMKTWKDYLPDYEIVCWDETNSLEIINANSYAKEAYEAKKYAFVSDYLRLYILYTYGGIYMDTDVQLYKSLDCFLDEDAFTSYEYYNYIPTALWASQSGHPWIKVLLDDYANRHFLIDSGYDIETNVQRITRITESFGFKADGIEKIIQFGNERTAHIYTKDYFCPINYYNRALDCFTENTYAAHLFNASWYPEWRRIASRLKKRLGLNPEKILGKKLYHALIDHI